MFVLLEKTKQKLIVQQGHLVAVMYIASMYDNSQS